MADFQGDIVRLSALLTRANEPSKALQLVIELNDALARQVKRRKPHSAVANALQIHLRHVAVHLAPRLTLQQAKAIIDDVLLASWLPCATAITAITATLTDLQIHAQTKRVIRRISTQLASQSFLCRCMKEEVDNPSHVASMLVSFPNHFANAMQGAIPTELQSEAWGAAITTAIFTASRLNQALATAVLDKLLATTSVAAIAHIVLPHVSLAAVPTLIAGLSQHSQRRLLETLLLRATASDGDATRDLMAVLLEHHGQCTRLLHRQLFAQPLSSPVKFVTVVMLLDDKPGLFSFASNMFADALQLWGKRSFVEGGDPSLHASLSQVLVLLSQWMPPSLLMDHVQDVMAGVQNHIACTHASKRTIGLAAAEVLVRHGMPQAEHKLDFKLHPEEDGVQLVRALIGLPEPSWDTLPTSSVKSQAAAAAEEAEPPSSAHVDSSGDDQRRSTARDPDLDSDDDSDGSDDEFASFAAPVPPAGPRYIRDAIDGLKIKDSDFEKWKLNLTALPDLIAQRPGELKHLTVELLRRAIHMQNEYNYEHFDSIIQRILLEVGSAHPLATARYLTSQFYVEEYSLHHRRLMLQALVGVALRVSGRDKETGEPSSASMTSKPEGSVEDGERSEKPAESAEAIIQARLAKKTRRFGSKPPPVDQGTANPFAAIAGEFFFPLLAKHDVSIRTLKLQSDDQWLLAALIRALGLFMQCAGVCPILNRMAITYIEFMLSTPPSSDVIIIQALATSLIMLVQTLASATTTLDAVAMATPSLVTWLKDTVSQVHDPSVQRLLVITQSLLLESAASLGE
eukprot:TRINITY_DN12319_c0_g1_i11.p1 TRINITY_DN12319_c0_g1~~TRINITY_DN12319_c0_g1_i11.p1  ORF type:complete len:799 (+),score=192.25 TRINITY_DN12319_c0_g1_i11:230-2626(+)